MYRAGPKTAEKPKYVSGRSEVGGFFFLTRASAERNDCALVVERRDSKV